MAKVRVQASPRDGDEIEDLEKGKGKGKEKSSEPDGVKPKLKYSGSMDVLRKVRNADGFLGWYQVGLFFKLTKNNYSSFAREWEHKY